MPFQALGSEALTDYIEVRLTPQEKQRLRDDADLAGITMSEFIRRRAFGRAILPSTDLAMIRELRRLGGLLKHVHVVTNGAHSKDTAAAVQQISHYIDQLSAGQEKLRKRP